MTFIYHNFKFAVLFFALIVTCIASCRKKPDPIDDISSSNGQYATVGFEFSNYVGNKPIALNVDTIVNSEGEQILPTKFNYYISNIRFKRSDGSEYVEEESYHLVSEDNSASKHFHLQKVPVGEYTSMTFMIGIDSARNVSGAQEGALDPAHGMFWTWNTGYIMAKLEGISPQANAPDYIVMHHVGGFSGEFKGQREVTLTFPEQFLLQQGTEGTIRMRADALKWYSGTNSISIAAVPIIMSANANSRKIADNYKDMFTITSVTVF